jgi:hypothetical protein
VATRGDDSDELRVLATVRTGVGGGGELIRRLLRVLVWTRGDDSDELRVLRGSGRRPSEDPDETCRVLTMTRPLRVATGDSATTSRAFTAGSTSDDADDGWRGLTTLRTTMGVSYGDRPRLPLAGPNGDK